MLIWNQQTEIDLLSLLSPPRAAILDTFQALAMAANDLQEQLLTNKSPRSKHVVQTNVFYADRVLWSLCIRIKHKTLSWPVT